MAGFVVLGLIPGLKYPANPPAVGSGETIGLRTGLFFLLVAASFASAMIAVSAGKALAPTQGGIRAAIIALALFAGLIAVTSLVLPSYNEVPADFPADVFMRFRLASLGTQAVLWLGIGAIFGLWVNRRPGVRRVRLPPDMVRGGSHAAPPTDRDRCRNGRSCIASLGMTPRSGLRDDRAPCDKS